MQFSITFSARAFLPMTQVLYKKNQIKRFATRKMQGRPMPLGDFGVGWMKRATQRSSHRGEL